MVAPEEGQGSSRPKRSHIKRHDSSTGVETNAGSKKAGLLSLLLQLRPSSVIFLILLCVFPFLVTRFGGTQSKKASASTHTSESTHRQEIESPSTPTQPPPRSNLEPKHGERESRFSAPAPVLINDQSGCSCYRVKNTFCCWQALCVCNNVCYNGSALLGQFKPYPCIKPESPLRPSRGMQPSPLAPVKCQALKRFNAMLGIALKEAPIPDGLDVRSPEWFTARQSLKRQKGTTYLQPLDQSESNISHLWGKVAQLLMINNASSVAPGLPFRVDRFLFPRHPVVAERMESSGGEGWHAAMLYELLALAAPDKEGAQQALGALRKRVRENSGSMSGESGSELVLFETPWNSSSEEHPLCFDRVVIPGILKAITFPAGPKEAAFFQGALRKSLNLDQSQSPLPRVRPQDPVNVLYLVRNGTRRTLVPESEKKLLSLLKELGLQVTTLELAALTFKDQFAVLQNAEIIMGLHGTALINAALATQNSVILEIMPFHAYHIGPYFSSINAGITYMLHECRQGTPQSRDSEFQSVEREQCMGIPECKEWFMQLRPVELTEEDVTGIRILLTEAKQFVLLARQDLRRAGENLREKFNTLCMKKQRDTRCQMDLIRSPAADLEMECIVRSSCS